MARARKKPIWVGVDLGGTKIQVTLFDDKLKKVGDGRCKTRGRLGVRSVLDRIVGLIDEVLVSSGATRGSIGGIGVGCPGPLDLDRGVILEAPNLGWKNVRVKAVLEKEFRRPVHILNDVDAGVFGEYRLGAGRGARCVVGIFPGTGVGGGCVYEGRILRGRKSSCMEIGHIPLLPGGPRSGAGLSGTLEALTGRLAVAAAASVAAQRGDAPHLLEDAGTDIGKIRSKVIAGAIAKGDKEVEAIVRDAARWLGVGISVVVHLLAPDVIVLGGGLVEAMPRIWIEEARASADARLLRSFRGTYRIKAALLGDDATSAGAAAWARETRGD